MAAPLRIALVGYGKMGRMLEQLAPEENCEVVRVFDIEHPLSDDAFAPGAGLGDVHAAIEFTEPSGAMENIRTLIQSQIPVVVGTTGWYDQLDEARQLVKAAQGSMVWAANFSIGVNVFRQVCAEAARLLASQSRYGAYAWEVHHAAKRDAPSGTLLRIVEAMRAVGYALPIDSSSNRAGSHPGTHEVTFDSLEDTLSFRHTARSREGFARGALQAAHLIAHRRGFYEFSELLFAQWETESTV